MVLNILNRLRASEKATVGAHLYRSIVGTSVRTRATIDVIRYTSFWLK